MKIKKYTFYEDKDEMEEKIEEKTESNENKIQPTGAAQRRKSVQPSKEEQIGKMMENNQKKKDTVKKMIWRLERILFFSYLSFGVLALIIISVSIKYTN